jgi:hypothetical protein
MTKKSDSKWLSLATASILGQPPRVFREVRTAPASKRFGQYKVPVRRHSGPVT